VLERPKRRPYDAAMDILAAGIGRRRHAAIREWRP